MQWSEEEGKIMVRAVAPDHPSSRIEARPERVQIRAVPMSLREANDFVTEHHRHNGRTARDGGRFAIGGTTEAGLFGVAIVGNPLSATYMDGLTGEVLRLCVAPGAPRNGCSFLYAACWRAWRAMGGQRLITYTLTSESGDSLRGAGWRVVGEVAPHNRWTGKKDHLRREWQPIYGQPKLRWEVSGLLSDGALGRQDGSQQGNGMNTENLPAPPASGGEKT